MLNIIILSCAVDNHCKQTFDLGVSTISKCTNYFQMLEIIKEKCDARLIHKIKSAMLLCTSTATFYLHVFIVAWSPWSLPSRIIQDEPPSFSFSASNYILPAAQLSWWYINKKILERDQWVQETRPPGSGSGLLVELEASMVGSVDAGAADDELCEVRPRTPENAKGYLKIKRLTFFH